MLILFSMFIGLGALMVSDLTSTSSGYNIANVSDPTFDATYNKLSTTTGLVDTASNQSRSGLGRLLGAGSDSFFGSTIVVLDLTFGSFGMINAIFSGFIQTFGIPAAIANVVFPALLAIITTIIVFVAISSLTRSKM